MTKQEESAVVLVLWSTGAFLLGSRTMAGTFWFGSHRRYLLVGLLLAGMVTLGLVVLYAVPSSVAHGPVVILALLVGMLVVDVVAMIRRRGRGWDLEFLPKRETSGLERASE